jgi:hypothetical protein
MTLLELTIATHPARFSVRRLGRRIRRLLSEGWTRADAREILELPRGMVRRVLRATR